MLRVDACRPDTATPEEEERRRYQLQLVDAGTSGIMLNRTITALRFFFGVTLERADATAKMSPVREPRRPPVVLSREEVARLIDVAGKPKYQTALSVAHGAGSLQFFGEHLSLAEPKGFTEWLQPLRQSEWLVNAKRPFAGPAAVLAYMSRYTTGFAIVNSGLIAWDEQGVTFKWKDY